MNDKFGIQCRGGCSCAGTYGHYLLNVSPDQSREITDMIDQGDYSTKPGWIRVSLHPTMTNQEVAFIAKSIATLAQNFEQWIASYDFNPKYNQLTSPNRVVETKIKMQIEHILTTNFIDNIPEKQPSRRANAAPGKVASKDFVIERLGKS